jgi:hypothetical protein
VQQAIAFILRKGIFLPGNSPTFIGIVDIAFADHCSK